MPSLYSWLQIYQLTEPWMVHAELVLVFADLSTYRALDGSCRACTRVCRFINLPSLGWFMPSLYLCLQIYQLTEPWMVHAELVLVFADLLTYRALDGSCRVCTRVCRFISLPSLGWFMPSLYSCLQIFCSNASHSSRHILIGAGVVDSGSHGGKV